MEEDEIARRHNDRLMDDLIDEMQQDLDSAASHLQARQDRLANDRRADVELLLEGENRPVGANPMDTDD